MAQSQSITPPQSHHKSSMSTSQCHPPERACTTQVRIGLSATQKRTVPQHTSCHVMQLLANLSTPADVHELLPVPYRETWLPTQSPRLSVKPTVTTAPQPPCFSCHKVVAAQPAVSARPAHAYAFWPTGPGCCNDHRQNLPRWVQGSITPWTVHTHTADACSFKDSTALCAVAAVPDRYNAILVTCTQQLRHRVKCHGTHIGTCPLAAQQRRQLTASTGHAMAAACVGKQAMQAPHVAPLVGGTCTASITTHVAQAQSVPLADVHGAGCRCKQKPPKDHRGRPNMLLANLFACILHCALRLQILDSPYAFAGIRRNRPGRT